MSPLIAALVACGGFAAFIVTFGILLPTRYAEPSPASTERSSSSSTSRSMGLAK
jgi:hypothetical protein